VVSLIRRQRQALQTRELEAPLAAYRLAAAALPDRDASLLDRLFALECLARAGRDAVQEREQLASALRSAEAYIDDEWEADVPHAAVLGQAIAAMDALDRQAPSEWVELLDQTARELLGREGRFGLGSDPRLLASVARGLAASGVDLPPALLRTCRTYIDERPTTDGVAEIADALLRHRTGLDLAAKAVETAFSSRHATDGGAAVARWWIADRWRKLTGDDVPAPVDAVDAARTQALIGAPPAEPRLAAMLAEVAAGSLGALVLLPAAALDELSTRQSAAAIREVRLWRASAVAAAAALLFIYLDDICAKLGLKPSDTTLKAAGAILCFVAAFAVAHLLLSAYKVGGRTVPPTLERFVDGFLPLLAALLSLFAH
jgi:hypothetical protein